MLFFTKSLLKGLIARKSAVVGNYSDDDFSISLHSEMRYDGPSAPEVIITYNHETAFHVEPDSIDRYELRCFREGKWMEKLNKLYRIARDQNRKILKEEYKRRFSPID